MPILFFCTLSLIGCSDSRNHTAAPDPDQAETLPDGHNSKISLDWYGTYGGVLPCADCEGVRTQITLFRDATFRRKVEYVGRDERVYEDDGSFIWSEDGGKIRIDNIDGSQQNYLVGEGHLLHLDRKGARITGPRAEKYRLDKLTRDPKLEDHTWEWVVQDSVDFAGRAVPSLSFDAEKRRLSGSDGCNRIAADYMLYDGGALTMGKTVATKMACPEMAVSESFRKMLGEVRSYTVTDSLVLRNENGVPLASFSRSATP